MDLSSARQAINGLTHREKITTNDLSEFFSADVTVRENTAVTDYVHRGD